MSLQQPAQFPISIGLAPQQAQGARGIGPIVLNFNVFTAASGLTNVISDDLIIEGEDGSINNIQAVYFDSSQCPLPVSFTIGDSQQTIIFPPKSQGYIPIMATNAMRYTAVGYGGGGVALGYQVLLTFLNVPVQPQIWSVMPLTGLVAAGVSAGNTVMAVSANNNGGVSMPLGRDVFVDGFDISGNGATAEGPITATLTNISDSNWNGTATTLSFVIDIPALGTPVSVSRRFDPPLRTIRQASNVPGSPALTVPAFGAGNTAAGVLLYYRVG